MVAAIVALLPRRRLLVSAMSGPSNTALGVRSVEWLRDNGAAGIVAQVETWYYSLTAPSKGGPTLKALPKVGVDRRRPTVADAGLRATPAGHRARRRPRRGDDSPGAAGRGRLAPDARRVWAPPRR